VRRLSLRGSMMLGAVLWTAGLFALAGAAFTFALARHPEVPAFAHAAFGHRPPVVFFALVCMLIGLMQVRRGLSPVNRLRARLADVHAGREPRVTGRYPAEVQPLVDDLNVLLDERERRVARAAARAGDLAHGLKTPLAVLAHEAGQAMAAGQSELAGAIEQQIDRMRRQIDRHLALARSTAAGTAPAARTPVIASAEALARTLLRLHAGRGLRIDVDADAAHAFRGQREDLDEMLGNLLDNACKWARSRVALASAVETGQLILRVDDDGPGLAASMRESATERGVRADETAPGSGLGLAIVRELAELYGGSVALAVSPLGGLRAELRLPLAG